MTAPSDQFNVTAAITPVSPKTGDTLTLTISGGDVQTTETSGSIGPLSLSLTAADGSTSTLTVDAVPYTLVTSTPESVKITSISDPTGRAWTVAAGGLTATATA